MLFLLTFFCTGILRLHYTRCMPDSPQIQAGKTNAIDAFYGKTVYVTACENRELHACYFAIAVFAVAYVSLMIKFAKIKRDDSQPTAK